MLYTACPINLAQVKKSSVGHFSFIVRALHEEEVKAALSISQNCAISYSNGYTPLIQSATRAMMYGDHAAACPIIKPLLASSLRFASKNGCKNTCSTIVGKP